MPGAVTYWRQGQPTQNMGDFLSQLFIERVLAPGPAIYPRIRLVGSVLSAKEIRADLQAASAGPVGYWGCGQRDEYIIDSALRAPCRFHGASGPSPRPRLGLPHTA